MIRVAPEGRPFIAGAWFVAAISAGFGWWWALHSLHHSQRQVTVWSDDRNHIVDDLLMTLALVVFAQFVGVQPDDYIDLEGLNPVVRGYVREAFHAVAAVQHSLKGDLNLPP